MPERDRSVDVPLGAALGTRALVLTTRGDAVIIVCRLQCGVCVCVNVVKSAPHGLGLTAQQGFQYTVKGRKLGAMENQLNFHLSFTRPHVRA